MRGPHNIWRLVRTGATLERTGAMRVVLDAFDAPVPLRIGARILGWPFAWLGYKGDTALPPATIDPSFLALSIRSSTFLYCTSFCIGP